MTTSDLEIVRLLGQQEPQAMELLYDAYGRLAYSLAFRVLRDGGAAEDVVQEAFLTIWRNGPTYTPEKGSLRGWLCTIVHRRAIDRLRSNRTHTGPEQSLETAAELGGDGGEVWHAVLENLERERLTGALAQLPGEQRQALELAYFGGYSQAEISTSLGVPLGTIKGRCRLALARLRACLSEEELTWAR